MTGWVSRSVLHDFGQRARPSRVRSLSPFPQVEEEPEPEPEPPKEEEADDEEEVKADEDLVEGEGTAADHDEL